MTYVVPVNVVVLAQRRGLTGKNALENATYCSPLSKKIDKS